MSFPFPTSSQDGPFEIDALYDRIPRFVDSFGDHWVWEPGHVLNYGNVVFGGCFVPDGPAIRMNLQKLWIDVNSTKQIRLVMVNPIDEEAGIADEFATELALAEEAALSEASMTREDYLAWMPKAQIEIWRGAVGAHEEYSPAKRSNLMRDFERGIRRSYGLPS